jgi:hypothetical protein
LIGDIVLTCSGGQAPGSGNVPAVGSTTPISTANITISLGTTVTSRLLSYASVNPIATLASNTSEAVLLIDEPGSGLPMGQYGVPASQTGGNYGPAAAQYLCGASGPGVAGTPNSAYGAGANGCVQYVQQAANGDIVASSSSTTVTPAPNMFAGIASGNQVTFNGIPILPPSSAGVARMFRITNIRINTNALAGGGLGGITPVLAYIGVSNVSVLIPNASPTVGFIQQGLTTALRNTSNTGGGGSSTENACSGPGAGSALQIVRFTENFGTAFKTRVAPTSATAGSGQAVSIQNIPGTIYGSESGFVTNLVTMSQYNATVGLADFGTRLKAVFNNVPSNVTLYVSTSNVTNLFTTVSPYGAIPAPAGNSTNSYAQLVLSETSSDAAGVTPAVSPTGYNLPSGTVVGGNAYQIGYAPVAVNAAGQGVAVWEVINTNPAALENFDFGVFISYSANAPAPTTSAATVTLSFAPTATEGAFPATGGGAGTNAQANMVLPRFSDNLSSASNLFTVALCTTNLLFPFITNQGGFDTGIAFMNTGQDPFGTSTQAGICTMNFYGNNAPAAVATPTIPAGNGNSSGPANTWAFLASSIAPNFEGYMIAICQFQFAHGYAFISDLGAQRLAHGYLALILTNGTSKRSATEALEN